MKRRTQGQSVEKPLDNNDNFHIQSSLDLARQAILRDQLVFIGKCQIRRGIVGELLCLTASDQACQYGIETIRIEFFTSHQTRIREHPRRSRIEVGSPSIRNGINGLCGHNDDDGEEEN
jgi:hypothetical protein